MLAYDEQSSTLGRFFQTYVLKTRMLTEKKYRKKEPDDAKEFLHNYSLLSNLAKSMPYSVCYTKPFCTKADVCIFIVLYMYVLYLYKCHITGFPMKIDGTFLLIIDEAAGGLTIDSCRQDGTDG